MILVMKQKTENVLGLCYKTNNVLKLAENQFLFLSKELSCAGKPSVQAGKSFHSYSQKCSSNKPLKYEAR